MFTNGVTMSKLVDEIGVAHKLIATSQQHLTKAQEETDRIISLLELEKGSKAELEKPSEMPLRSEQRKQKIVCQY